MTMSAATNNVTATELMTITSDRDIISLLTAMRHHASQIGMNLLNQTKLITATSELTRNMLNYAGKGQITIEQVKRDKQLGIRVTFADNGPGIADIDQVMQNGYSSAKGMGLGLPGAKRLTDEFLIESIVGQGTKVTISKWTNG